MQRIVERLERHDPPFLKTRFPEQFKAWFQGQNLNLMQTNPDTDFQQAEKSHQHMADLFPAAQGIDSYMMRLLSPLNENRPNRAAPGPDNAC